MKKSGETGRFAQVIDDLRRHPRDLDKIIERHQGRSLLTRPDQLIYSQRDPLDEVYVLARGMVRLFVGEDKKERTSLFLRAPAIFGDRDILAGCLVSQESAESVAKSHLLRFRRDEFEADYAALDETHQNLRRVLTADLVQRYARSIRFADYLALPLEHRILWLLWEFSQIDEKELPRYETLARLADSSAKSVGRAVRKLLEEESLQVRKGRGFTVALPAAEELGVGEMLGVFHSFAVSGE